MSEVIAQMQQSFLKNIRVFMLGLLWTCAGGLGPAAMELWTDVTDYKEYGIDWKHVWWMAASGMAPLAIGFWRKHQALLALPEDIKEALAKAEMANEQPRTTTLESLKREDKP